MGKVISSQSAVESGPLDPALAETFAGGRYKVVELSQDTILHRAGTADRPFGQFFDVEPPKGVLQTRIDKAVLPVWPNGAKSPIDTAFGVRIPQGTRVSVGEVGIQNGFYIGGTQQIVVVKPWEIGAEVVSSSPLK